MQTTPMASKRIVTTVFGRKERNTMISNEQSERLGPGPAAYDHLKSLKKMVVTKGREGPVFRAPSDLNEKVK